MIIDIGHMAWQARLGNIPRLYSHLTEIRKVTLDKVLNGAPCACTQVTLLCAYTQVRARWNPEVGLSQQPH